MLNKTGYYAVSTRSRDYILTRTQRARYDTIKDKAKAQAYLEKVASGNSAG